MSHIHKALLAGTSLGLIHELDKNYFELLTPVHHLLHEIVGIGGLTTTALFFLIGAATGYIYWKDDSGY